MERPIINMRQDDEILLVSVLINSYNYGKYLDHCVQSVLEQSYPNIELIVYDDGSNDDSVHILKKYNDSIKLICKRNFNHPPNINQANAIYEAFKQSRGDIICLLDSDDAFQPEKVKKVVEVFKNNKSVSLVQHLLTEIDEKNYSLNNIRPLIKDIKDIKKYVCETHHIFNLFAPTSGLSFSRAFLEQVLPLKRDDRNYLWPDARLSFQSIFYGNVVTLFEPLSQYRIHGNNDSSKLKDPQIYETYIEQKYGFFNEILKFHEFPTIKRPDKSTLSSLSIFTDKINRQMLSAAIERNKHKQFIIWGSGEAGQAVEQFLISCEVPINCYIDRDTKKIGGSINGVRIHAIEEKINSHNCFFIIAAFYAFEEISRDLKNKGFVEGEDFISPFTINVLNNQL